MCRSLFLGALPEPVLSRDAEDQVSNLWLFNKWSRVSKITCIQMTNLHLCQENMHVTLYAGHVMCFSYLHLLNLLDHIYWLMKC